MNGVHDMGGLTCFGAVTAEEDEPVFHHEWERRIFALSVAMAGAFGPIDARRYALEVLDPAFILYSSYYERWWARLDVALIAKGVLSEPEMAAVIAGGEAATVVDGAVATEPPASAESIETRLRQGIPTLRDSEGKAPRFAVGDLVRARNLQPEGHTRLPRYARGRTGVINMQHGSHVFPDANAHGRGEQPNPLYNVRFTAAELWGPETGRNDSLCIDLWEEYLEPAERGEA